MVICPQIVEAAHLDLFAEKLFKQPKLRAYVIAYSESRVKRGSYLRNIGVMPLR